MKITRWKNEQDLEIITKQLKLWDQLNKLPQNKIY